MGFEFYKESYAGAIKEVSIGEGSKAVIVGGETCYPFYQFEGLIPHKPKIAMEVWDIKPSDWPDAAISPFKDVITDPARWAKKCVDDYGAEIIVLQLKSTDPNGANSTPEDASSIVKKVLSTIDVPLIVWGVCNAEKDEAVFKKIAEDCQSSNLTLGPVEDKNHKSIGAAAMGYGHSLISSSPIDVNLAKQVNILLENLGMSMNKILIDPTTGGLGYGLEYSYSVMERLRMAAITQGDDKLQMPIVNNLGNEIWKCKEVKQGTDEAPLLGDPEKRGILMEAIGAVVYLMAGSNLLIMRHPESIRLVKSYIDLVMNGGSGMEIGPISKRLEAAPIDLAILAPKPDLTIVDDEPKKVTSAKKSIQPSKSETIKAKEIEKQKEVREAKIEKRADLKIKEEKTERKAVMKEEAKKDEKLKFKEAADREAKEAADREAKKAADREAKEKSLKEKRAAERLKNMDDEVKRCVNDVSKMTPALEQKDSSEKIIDKLQWVHKRIKLYSWD